MKTLKILGGFLCLGAIITLFWVTADIGTIPIFISAKQNVTVNPIPEETISAVASTSVSSVVSPYSYTGVATHNNSADCWTIISGSIYDLTSWVSQHPGGSESILNICGIDATSAFEGQHGGQRRPQNVLQKYYVASLVQ